MIGSHNAWSFLKPKKWYLRPFAFMAKCQDKNIQKQYAAGSRYFDLRIRFDKHMDPVICHGAMEYKYTPKQLEYDFKWLDFQGDAYIRIILELRGKYAGTENWQKLLFLDYYNYLHEKYPSIVFLNGATLPSGEKVLDLEDLPIAEMYSSVCPPKLLDDWIPIIYAKLHNKKNMKKYSDLLMDFV